MARSFLPSSIKKRIPIIMAVALTLFFVNLAYKRSDLTDDSFLTSLERRWIDAKFRLRGSQLPGKEVLIVGIDDKTVNALGSYRTFARDTWATLIDHLASAQPKTIGFDIYFSEPEANNPDNDRKFAESVAKAGNVVLGVYLDLASNTASQRQASVELTDAMKNTVTEKQIFPAELQQRPEGQRQVSYFIRGKNLIMNIPPLTDAAASFGFVNFHPDAEGFLRHQPQFIDYHDNLYPSLDLQLLRRYLNTPSPIVEFDGEQIVQVELGKYIIPTDMFGRYMVNFDGPRGIHETVSMIDVIQGKISPAAIKDRIVLIGAPAVGLSDVIPTPFDATLPGVELHANVIDNILHERYLLRDGAVKFLDLALILILGTLLGIYLPRMNASRSVGYSSLLLAGFTILNVLSFILLRWVMSYVYPGMALVFVSGSMISYKYLTEERERKRTKQTFQYYLDEHVIEQVMNDPEMLRLGGEKREMSVLFSDIRGFTSFSEKMAPSEVVHFLNQYFDKMTGMIFQYKGTLDKLIGDAVMCFWGHPIETKEHALRATLCALEMIQAVEDLRPILILPGGAKFEIGIGINTGPMVVGNMGSQSRFSYTVMGDNVNLGSRLESLNKYYGTRILISDTTYDEIKDIVFCRQLDTIQVKGRSNAVTIYEPVGMRRPENERRIAERRGIMTLGKKLKRAIVMVRYGDRRREERRMGSDRIVVKPEQIDFAMKYETALSLYRRGEFDAAERAFDQVLAINPSDGPTRLIKGRIETYRPEYAGTTKSFDPVYKFDEK